MEFLETLSVQISLQGLIILTLVIYVIGLRSGVRLSRRGDRYE